MVGGDTSKKGSITFKNFKWTLAIDSVKLKFSVSSPLNFKGVESPYSLSIADTDERFYAETEAITLSQ